MIPNIPDLQGKPYRVCQDCGNLINTKMCQDCKNKGYKGKAKKESQAALAERIGGVQQTVSRWIGYCKKCYDANSSNIGRAGNQIATYLNQKIEAGMSVKEILSNIQKEKSN